MSFWIELHCNVKRAPEALDEPVCRSHRNDNPGAMAPGASGVTLTATHLAKEARSRGWKRGAQGWECDNCQKLAKIERAEARAAERMFLEGGV